MITFNKIEPPTVEVWNKDGFFARVNEYEFNDIRIQVKNEKSEDFYVLFENKRLRICSNGSIDSWPKGFFDLFENQLHKLAGWDESK